MDKLYHIWGYVYRRGLVVVMTVLLVLFTELMGRGSWKDTLAWGSGSFAEFFLNVLLVGSLFFVLIALIGRTRWAFWILFAALFLLGLISGIKLKMLGVPLLPWDFVLTGETQDMVQYLTNIFTLPTVSGFIVFVGLHLFVLYKLDWVEKKWNWQERGILAVVGLAVLGVLTFEKPVSLHRALSVSNMPWDQAENVRVNGLALTMLNNTHLMKREAPDGYNRETIEAFLPAEDRKPELPGVKPNVIVILGESFWDPTQIPGVTFNEDPVPTFHKLMKEYSSGWLLSPQFGGTTANVEFEVLSGLSMRFLPQGSIPYNQYMTRGIDSLAGIFSRHGYNAVAISPFHSWFFNSKQVYKNLGFNQFLSIEFFRPEYSGPYIADKEVGRMIVDEAKSTDGPDFIFANTMENHFHFYPGKFPENPFTATAPGASAGAVGQLETLARGMRGTDEMLKMIVDYFEQSSEPTVVVFFGDHLPYLGDDYQVYKETGWISGPDDPDFLEKIYRTPVFVWDNYLNKPREDLGMSPSFLGPYVLNRIGMPGTAVTDYLYALYREMPVIPPQNYYEKYGVSAEKLKPYEQLQYDVLFGEQYAYEGYKDKIVKDDYVLGYGPLEIAGVQADGENGIVVTGRNLPPLGVVYWNGAKLETKWQSLECVRAVLPDGQKPSDGGEVQVKVYDSKETVVGQSNTFTFK
ncbi:LTA synthase family protein [Paenibacillus thermoaerophilus]|uniref:LTA synthase family protein n=1 Tax=Paenibacillus thermoaerophilus TaxID=1215385 RepID=A0ABW2V3S1_9BACL|nr:LTA synthase family protein [Paenibacillus thermoaerophilus]TMV18294.1 LTA synthase family protein [Paenibacillus thermoaerophilus]